MAKDFDKEIERRILANEEKLELIEGDYDLAFDQSFADHAKANAAAERMSEDMGENAVYEALLKNPDAFGSLPEGVAAFDRALDQRRLLPGLFAQYRALRDKTDALRRTQQNRAEAAKESPSGTPTSTATSEAGADHRKIREAYSEFQKNRGKQAGAGRPQELEAEFEPE